MTLLLTSVIEQVTRVSSGPTRKTGRYLCPVALPLRPLPQSSPLDFCRARRKRTGVIIATTAWLLQGLQRHFTANSRAIAT